MCRLCQQRPDTLLVIFISKVLETAVPQTSPVQRTKKKLGDLEGESEMLGNQMIFSRAWGSPSRRSVDLLCPKLVHDLPVKVLLLSFVPALGYDWKYFCSAPLSPSMPLGPPSSPGHAAKAGFALAPIPPAPLPPLAAAGLPQPRGHPDCKSAETALIHAVPQQRAAPSARSCCASQTGPVQQKGAAGVATAARKTRVLITLKPCLTLSPQPSPNCYC